MGDYYRFEVGNLHTEEALANLQEVVESDYFSDYDLSQSGIEIPCLRLEFGGYDGRGKSRKLGGLARTLSTFIRQIKMQPDDDPIRAHLDLRSSEAMNKRIGLTENPENEDPNNIPLYFHLEKSNKGVYFIVFNLGLNRLFYESHNWAERYHQDLAAFNKGFKEIDEELRRILSYQSTR
ncbi:MAG: hypothetical protein PHH54_01050 [Candidatus Nanoarchaeia archaeon]|nr:hypothetical protein [Candidatus Nanoarchaeia archaeon]MDD5740551.1 hypothetical protein [Candidatus Nanoarchaeia archaeon]